LLRYVNGVCAISQRKHRRPYEANAKTAAAKANANLEKVHLALGASRQSEIAEL